MDRDIYFEKVKGYMCSLKKRVDKRRPIFYI